MRGVGFEFPQFFELIEIARFGLHDVNHDVTQIHQHLFPTLLTFHTAHFAAEILYSFAQSLG